MRLKHGVSAALLLASFAAAETVSGVSAGFYFPGGTGIARQRDGLFSAGLRSRVIKKHGVLFSWKAPAADASGSLSIYSPDGTEITTVQVRSPEGSLLVAPRERGVSNGIYFAVLRFGSVRHHLRFTTMYLPER
jgi:hypothetical protein